MFCIGGVALTEAEGTRVETANEGIDFITSCRESGPVYYAQNEMITHLSQDLNLAG